MNHNRKKIDLDTPKLGDWLNANQTRLIDYLYDKFALPKKHKHYETARLFLIAYGIDITGLNKTQMASMVRTMCMKDNLLDGYLTAYQKRYGASTIMSPAPAKPMATSRHIAIQHVQRQEKEKERVAVTVGKKDDDFYKSPQWRKLRYEILRQRGARCECCGRTAADGVVIHVDHIKSRSKYPELALEITNLQVLCEDCNLGKSNRYEDDWRRG